MNGNCHFVFGAAVATSIAINMDAISTILPNVSASAETTTLLILGGLLGGIFPDIDNPTSHVGKLSIPISSVLGKIGEATGKTGSHHRGIMHDAALYLAGLILSYFYFTPVIGLFIGCLSHLFLDMFNPSGIPFLFGAARLRLGKISSGDKSGVIFTWINVILVLAAGIAAKILIS